MIQRWSYILAFLVITAAACMAESGNASVMTLAEYGTEVDRLLSATQQLDKSPEQVQQLQRDLPSKWQVRAEQQTFEISTDWLREDLLKVGQDHDPKTVEAIRARLESLRKDLAAYQNAPIDMTESRNRLASILARQEFRDVHGPTWLDRLKRRLVEFLFDMLGRLFGSSMVPTIGKWLVYVLVGIAVLALAIWAYRSIRISTPLQRVVPTDLPVSAKEWSLWMSEARAAAGQRNWRDAIHLAYWAGISFLEGQGMWKPDRARTPREYLRLLPALSGHRETLAALTRTFEIIWYGKREADEAAFTRAMQELEKLGCRPS